MTDELSFIAAIRDNRDDDLRRLAYADWLDDRAGPGDAERARLIRLQMERYRLPETDPLPRMDGEVRRQTEELYTRPRAQLFWLVCERRPPDDLPVGRQYDFWGPGAARPRVMRYHSGYAKLSTSQWAGYFTESQRQKETGLRRAEREILTAPAPWKHGHEICWGSLWSRPLLDLGSSTRANDSWTPEGWERGFPTRVELCPGDRWVKHADQVLAHIPLEEVELASLPQIKRHRRKAGIYGYETWAEIWLGDKPRRRAEDLRGAGPLDLLRHYWPDVKFTLAR